MRDDKHPTDKSWLEKIAHWFSTEPRSRDDLIELLHFAQQNDVIDADVNTIIQGALRVDALQVREIMIPRTQMIIIRAEQTVSAILPIITESAHSRYPVVGETIDDIRGVLLAKDLLPHLLQHDNRDVSISDLLRPVTVVPESKRLNILLREFRENRRHMAVVIDEYGGVAGLITIEDVLEQIVGDIEDEHDVAQDESIQPLDDNQYHIKALTSVDAFNDYFGSDFSHAECGTIGGIILQHCGHLPKRGEHITLNGFVFEVIEADKRQLHLLQVQRVADNDKVSD